MLAKISEGASANRQENSEPRSRERRGTKYPSHRKGREDWQ